jgi:hypothetical protein
LIEIDFSITTAAKSPVGTCVNRLRRTKRGLHGRDATLIEKETSSKNTAEIHVLAFWCGQADEAF